MAGPKRAIARAPSRLRGIGIRLSYPTPARPVPQRLVSSDAGFAVLVQRMRVADPCCVRSSHLPPSPHCPCCLVAIAVGVGVAVAVAATDPRRCRALGDAQITCANCGAALCPSCARNRVTRAVIGATAPAAHEQTVRVCAACYRILCSD